MCVAGCDAYYRYPRNHSYFYTSSAGLYWFSYGGFTDHIARRNYRQLVTTFRQYAKHTVYFYTQSWSVQQSTGTDDYYSNFG